MKSVLRLKPGGAFCRTDRFPVIVTTGPADVFRQDAFGLQGNPDEPVPIRKTVRAFLESVLVVIAAKQKSALFKRIL